MREGLTEIVFIIDRSGSMGGLESDTIGGFNSMIEKQKKEEGEAIVSTVLFDDRSEVIYDRVDLKKVEPMNDTQYYVRGCTALLDALGGAVKHIKTVHKYAREDDRPEKTVFIVTTDGMENSSRKYDYDDDIKAGYIRLEVTDRYVGPDTFAYFSEKYPLLLEMKGLDYSEEGAEITLTMEEFEEKSKDPEEIFRSFCTENNLELTEDNIALFKEILNEMAEEA